MDTDQDMIDINTALDILENDSENEIEMTVVEHNAFNQNNLNIGGLDDTDEHEPIGSTQQSNQNIPNTNTNSDNEISELAVVQTQTVSKLKIVKKYKQPSLNCFFHSSTSTTGLSTNAMSNATTKSNTSNAIHRTLTTSSLPIVSIVSIIIYIKCG
jgi:hypothetical protein